MKSTDLYEFTFTITRDKNTSITVIDRNLAKATTKASEVLGNGSWDLCPKIIKPFEN